MSFIRVVGEKVKFVLIRKIFPAIIYLIYGALPRKKGRLLVIKADGIGDYLLFRNYLRCIKRSQKYGDSQLYLAVNLACKPLASHLDGDITTEFFTYSESYFLKWDLLQLMWRLQHKRFETIIYPNYSRGFQVDWLIRHLTCTYKIGVDGDCINESEKLKANGDRHYSRLVDTESGPVHEFERNKQIVESIIHEKCFVPRPIIEKDKLNIMPNGAIIIFSGASSDHKKWPAGCYNALCRRLYQELGADVIFVPGKVEAIEMAAGALNLPPDSYRVAANLDMIGLCNLIGGAALLISGDTVAIHIAAALGVPAVCICKGDLYGRFVPYPARVFDELFCVLPRSLNARDLSYNQWSPAKIEEVELEDVFEAVLKARVLKNVIRE